ncbi:MAG: hypothetical protein A2201_09750 [Alicyclobacillus sp. RIFOXYA1_FULL_53_8]|nr:MAG: hypothetical protein A2201_09750 [Alicyclobacillus sp. RIFOXYA1_FULL_53_8]
MLNKRQREFRESMKQSQREQKQAGYEGPYSYREENYRPRRYKKPLFVGGGGVAFLILLWNVYAVSTWFHPQHINAPSPVDTTTGTPAFSSGSDNTQQQVNDYIQTSATIQQQLTALIEPFLNPSTLNVVSTQTFSITESQLNTLQQTALTTLGILTPLRSYNLSQIELIQSALMHIKAYRGSRNPSDWQLVQQFLKQYNNNLVTQQSIVISVLSEAHMTYQIDANGHVTYQYTQTGTR